MTQVTIAGHAFEIEDKYSEGHTLSTSEARALNQLRRENIRNNMAKAVKEATEKGEDPTQAVADYAASYEFSMPGTGGGTRQVRDPVEKEARAIAKAVVIEKLAAETPPRKLKDVDKDRLEENITRIAASEKVLKMARKRVADRQKASDELLADVDLAA